MSPISFYGTSFYIKFCTCASFPAINTLLYPLYGMKKKNVLFSSLFSAHIRRLHETTFKRTPNISLMKDNPDFYRTKKKNYSDPLDPLLHQKNNTKPEVCKIANFLNKKSVEVEILMKLFHHLKDILHSEMGICSERFL